MVPVPPVRVSGLARVTDWGARRTRVPRHGSRGGDAGLPAPSSYSRRRHRSWRRRGRPARIPRKRWGGMADRPPPAGARRSRRSHPPPERQVITERNRRRDGVATAGPGLRHPEMTSVQDRPQHAIAKCAHHAHTNPFRSCKNDLRLRKTAGQGPSVWSRRGDSNPNRSITRPPPTPPRRVPRSGRGTARPPPARRPTPSKGTASAVIRMLRTDDDRKRAWLVACSWAIGCGGNGISGGWCPRVLSVTGDPCSNSGQLS
ncbi:hypothetical protein FrEUN1fDRAFT_5370 [Parafrankia sp. EUN1f]|nr:hypothetical protein FrEUN1fDRAFT_5370 [Parafrankia sp. EUN1f]